LSSFPLPPTRAPRPERSDGSSLSVSIFPVISCPLARSGGGWLPSNPFGPAPHTRAQRRPRPDPISVGQSRCQSASRPASQSPLW
jgi:hypothetical protein